jgi:hypothetical protein
MNKRLVLPFLLSVAFVSAAPAETDGAPGCSGFPWTVTATPFGADSVAVRICGTAAGCEPHNPQFSISGSEIHVTLTQAELPDCQCLAVVDPFQQTVLVHPVAPGNYTIDVTTISCGERTPAGSANFVFGAASAIPALGPASAAALALLLAVVAILRLR